MPTVPAASTALVLIDLQKGVVNLPGLMPRDGITILTSAKNLAETFRSHKAPVVLVNVAFSADGGDALRQTVDSPAPTPPGGFPEDWSELADGLARPGDVLVTKHQWGAFHGTDLDDQLRRRGIKTIVLGGIATNIGVESTARQAHEHGYELIIVEDLTATFSPDMQAFAVNVIFPMLSRVVVSDSISLG